MHMRKRNSVYRPKTPKFQKVFKGSNVANQ